MKKQLTVFAATAMLATFATAVMAASTPTITGYFNFPFAVAYDITTSTWLDKADNLLDHANYENYISIAFPAGTSNAHLNGISVNYWYEGAMTTAWNPGVSLTGTMPGGSLTLGSVGFWQDGVVGSGTDGVGGSYSGTFGPISVIAGSSAPAGFGRVGVKLSDTNSVYAGVATKADFSGVAYAGGAFTAGVVTGNAQAAVELGDDNGTGLLANATVAVNDMLSFNATAVMADTELKDAPFLKVDAIALVDNEMSNIGWAASNATRADGLNVKVGATVKPIENLTLTGNYFYYANADWKTVATASYSPFALTSASVTMWSDKTLEAITAFDKTIAGVAFYATAAYKDNSADALDATYYAYLKGSKVWEGWLTTWASFGVHAYNEAAKAKVGASAFVSF